MSTKKSLSLVTLLATSLLLTACGSQTQSPKSSVVASNNKVTAVSSSQKTSTSFSKDTTNSVQPSSDSSKTTPGSNAVSPAVSNSATGEEKPKIASSPTINKTYTSSLNIDAMLQGDFSSLAGTWVNGKGQSVIIDSNGVVTSFDASHEVSPWRIDPDTGMLSANVWLKPAGAGVGIMVLPAGKVAVVRDGNGNTIAVEMTLDERDHIEVGQDWAKPDERYYRQ